MHHALPREIILYYLMGKIIQKKGKGKGKDRRQKTEDRSQGPIDSSAVLGMTLKMINDA